ncbi:MAG: signal peptidase I [Coprobacillus sp.]|nr:signal peptidase I [Coprobacillus sp.]
MTNQEIIVLVVTVIALLAFVLVITILYYHYIKSSMNAVQNGSKDIELLDRIVYENQPKVVRRQRAGRITKNVIYYLVLVILIPVFVFGIYSRATSGVASFGSYTVLVVGSGSMSEKNEANTYLRTYSLNDQLQTYDMIVVKKVEQSQISRYDTVAYRDNTGTIIIHRIISVTRDNDTGTVLYETRGDANNASDAYLITYNDIIGRYTGQRVPYLGMVITFFQSWAGIATILAVIYTMVIISSFNHRYDKVVYDREVILNDSFDIDSMNLDTYKEMEIKQGEKIYYQGNTYEYTSDLKFTKREMTEDEKKEYADLSLKSQQEANTKSKKKEKN